MTSLVLAEHDNARLNEATAKTVAAASKLGGDVHVLVAGKGASRSRGGGGEARRRGEGAARRSPTRWSTALAEPLAALIVSLAGPYDALLAPATSGGKNVMPRVAALLDVMQVSDVIEVLGPDTFRRPTYAGNAIQTVKSKDAKKVVTIRTASFPAAEAGGSAAPIENVAAPRRSGSLHLRRGERREDGAAGACRARKSSSPAAARSARRRNSWK